MVNHKGIEIIKNDAEKQSEEDVENEVRLVQQAIDQSKFDASVKEIRIIEKAHSTTGGHADDAHLTLKLNPGSFIGRLYLVPKDALAITSDTKISDLVLTICESGGSWNSSPGCAEMVKRALKPITAHTSPGPDGVHFMRAVFVRSGRMWENGTTLTYSFLDDGTDIYSINRQAKVATVIQEWEKYANIKFVPAPKGSAGIIRITFDRDSGSWSYVGKENLDISDKLPTMNLGWVYGESTRISDDERGVILHEFGHALGLMHEHQSPTRGEKITLKEDAVIEFYMRTQQWSKEDVEDQIIRVYNASEVSNYSEFDETSIMMYFMPAAMNEQHHKIPPNNSLSEMDKAFMVINYPSDDRDQFSDALESAGVPASEKINILEFYDSKEWTRARSYFTTWCNKARVAPKGDSNPFTSAHKAQKGVAVHHIALWLPGERITYCFLQDISIATEHRRLRVKQTFRDYARRTNLYFEEIDDTASFSIAKIRISFEDDPKKQTKSWSMAGRASVKHQLKKTSGKGEERKIGDISMYFSNAVPKTPPTKTEDKTWEARTLYRGVARSLGLLYEHLDSDSMGWMATDFDPKSIMSCSLDENVEDPDWTPQYMKVNNKPSDLDFAFLGAIYPHPQGDAKDRFLKDLRTLSIADTESYMELRKTAFEHFSQPDFEDRIEAIRSKLHDDLRTLVKGEKTWGPSNSILAPQRQRTVAPPTKTPTSGSFLDELMKQLSALFRPTSAQIFALQFPGRFLQKDLYAWDTTKAGIYGQFVKPTVVNESEFRLVDQLYNVGTVIGAPSGINLSIVYEQVLNNLVPGIQESEINFSVQQGQIRQWLLKDVPTSGWVRQLIASQSNSATGGASKGTGAAHSINLSPPTSISDTTTKPQFSVANKVAQDSQVNRLELAAALMQEYLAAKQAWELERDEMMKNASDKDLDALSRRLAHITAIREQQLAAKYGDAVVRGYSHAIRQYFGYMDIKTPAEALQDAKDSLRESAVSSLDGSMKVYPVQMQPIDWFQSLSTSFTMEDLTANSDLILQQIDSKSKQLDALNSRLAVLQGKPKIDIGRIQKELDSAQSKYADANAALTSTYATNVISLAKACINANHEFSKEDFVFAAKKQHIVVAAVDNLEAGMEKVTKASLDVQRYSRSLTQLMAEKSLAEATDTSQEITETTLRITALNKDISELTARAQSLRYKDGSTTAVPSQSDSTSSKVSLKDVLQPAPSSGGSRWQDVSLSHEVDTKYSASSTQTNTSIHNTSVPLFFGSYHSESTSSSTSTHDVEKSQNLKVEVGFRATLVTVDRGGWFQPQFFKQSAGFHNINPTITWSKWPQGYTAQDFTGTGKLSTEEAEAACNELNKYLFPAFPTGFVICKDITIKIQSSSTDIEKSAAEMESYAATSAGVLCFSTNSSSSSKESDKAYGFQACADGCVIRIPGPQILGYILQLTDPDTTTGIPEKLPTGFLISDKDYDSTFKVPHGLHSILDTTHGETDKPEEDLIKVQRDLAKAKEEVELAKAKELVKAKDKQNQVAKAQYHVSKTKDELAKAEDELAKAKEEVAGA
ncbi:hypothetical protein CPB83DRAFT_882060 [Crepidotus variabilis]|uniref:Peptidase metallopeptidase domain-containing protein n=1 Tax=Crepidotus variabilis TaxID=179855 RepID=A0A9P6EK33_9AGAR|nr:hypothetical protein CPB83DRAFT_882060 [Crepidotus variabilis]